MSKIHRLFCTFAGASTVLIQLNFASGLDPSFRSTLNGRASTLALQEDGRMVVSGFFTNDLGVIYLARLLTNGSVDQSFTPVIELLPDTPQMPVNKVEIQADGKILIAGAFTRVNGSIRPNIARLNPDGSLDQSFNPILHSESGPPNISEIVVQSDGKILLGGAFDAVNLVGIKSLARLSPDGVLDTTFVPFRDITNERVWVFGFALQKDSKVLVYGRFVTTPDNYRNYILRLNSDGSLDSTFAVDTKYDVELLTVLPDQKLLIGGDFYHVDGVPRDGLARLQTNGTLDADFAPIGNYGAANVIFPLLDGTILLGGGFEKDHQIGGVPSIPPTGFRYPTTGLVRLDVDGTLDRTFNGEIEDPTKNIWDIDMQKDGKILLVGQLETSTGYVDGGVVRLEPLRSELSICCVTVENSSLRFNIISRRSRVGLVEFSTNMGSWEAAQSIQLDAGIAAQFIDTNFSNGPRRFYRVSTGP